MLRLKRTSPARAALSILKNQCGQSLIQVMIVAAVGLIIAVGLATVMNNMQLAANSVKYRSDSDNFNEEIRALLSSPVACINSFGGLVVSTGATFDVTSLFDGSPAPGVVRYTTGNTYGDNSLILSSMVLANYLVGGAPNTAQMTLTNNLNTKKQALGPQGVVRTINLSLQFDASNNITSCIALAKMSDGIWQRSQANTNNIFFNGPPAPATGGNVGIGTTTPAANLHVEYSSNDTINVPTALSPKVGMRLSNADTTNNNFTSIRFGTTDVGGNIGFAGVIGTQFTSHVASTIAGDMYFLTSSGGYAGLGERMRITGDGNVGIGTMSPRGLLHLQVATTDPGAGNGIRIQASSDNQKVPGLMFLDGSGTYIGLVGGATQPAKFATDANLGDLVIRSNGGKVIFPINSPLGVDGPANWPTALAIDKSGNVGIGIINPSYTLHVVGTAGLSTGTAWTNASDIRLKDLHGDYEYGLDEVIKLHTVRFTYKKDNPLGLPSDHPMTGFIAQEVQKVIPDAVHENQNGYLELNVDPIHWAVVNAVRELKNLNDDIYERFAGHDRAIASVKADANAKAAKLEAENEKLKQENAAIKVYLCGKDPSAEICK